MAVLSWGKPTIKIDTTTIDTPKEGTTKLNVQTGDKVPAPLEGGGTKDVRYKEGTGTLEFDLYIGKDDEDPFEGEIKNGVLEGEHKVTVTPEDPTCKGIQIDRAVLNRTTSYDAEMGILQHYVIDALSPKDGSEKVKITNGEASSPAPSPGKPNREDKESDHSGL